MMPNWRDMAAAGNISGVPAPGYKPRVNNADGSFQVWPGDPWFNAADGASDCTKQADGSIVCHPLPAVTQPSNFEMAFQENAKTLMPTPTRWNESDLEILGIYAVYGIGALAILYFVFSSKGRG